jgi:Tfp pilus assembly protein PilV
MALPRTISAKARREKGSMLLELLIAMVVLTVGLGGLLVLLLSSLYTDNNARRDTSSTMVAEHVLEQISAQPANSVTPLTMTDCANNAWTIETAGAAIGAGNSGPHGGNGAQVTGTGVVDWSQTYANVPAGYAMQYVACGSAANRPVYDVRWNVVTMSTYTRMIFVSARPANSNQVGGLRYIVPVNLRTIGGM